MPAPKKPNTAAATAAVRRRGQETAAKKLRAAGWLVVPPENLDESFPLDGGRSQLEARIVTLLDESHQAHAAGDRAAAEQAMRQAYDLDPRHVGSLLHLDPWHVASIFGTASTDIDPDKWASYLVDVHTRAAFPGLPAISGFRPGAVTLTGHRSYHAVGRAVDFPASHALAQWVNAHYFTRAAEQQITRDQTRAGEE